MESVDLTRALELYQDGMTIQEVADALEVSYGALRNALLRQGIEIRATGVDARGREYRKGQPLLSDSEKRLLAMMYLAGYTARQLAEKFGLTVKRTEKYLAAMKVRKTK